MNCLKCETSHTALILKEFFSVLKNEWIYKIHSAVSLNIIIFFNC